MHRLSVAFYLLVLVLGTAYALSVAEPLQLGNPDPNHNHADFAVWIGGKEMDFSLTKYMSGTVNGVEKDLDPFFHLHDGNGHVLHRHKPGLGYKEFFASIGFDSSQNCSRPARGLTCIAAGKTLRLFVNGVEEPYQADYVFADGDHLLITDATDDAEVAHEQSLMTNDACLYSRTCRWRGSAPTEGCIADPTVPCRE